MEKTEQVYSTSRQLPEGTGILGNSESENHIEYRFELGYSRRNHFDQQAGLGSPPGNNRLLVTYSFYVVQKGCRVGSEVDSFTGVEEPIYNLLHRIFPNQYYIVEYRENTETGETYVRKARGLLLHGMNILWEWPVCQGKQL